MHVAPVSPCHLPGGSWRGGSEDLPVNLDDHIYAASVGESGVRGTCLVRIAEILFSKTSYGDVRVGQVHVKCLNLENTLGLIP